MERREAFRLLLEDSSKDMFDAVLVKDISRFARNTLDFLTGIRTLKANGVEEADIPDYSVAGCQEPLIMGKDNANTTNSWLNLPKVLEMVLTGGCSTITGEKLMDTDDYELSDIRGAFYKTLEKVIDGMTTAANGASVALSELKVPFLSAFMGGLEYGADMRDTKKQGTKYNGSGCLVHGLTVLADSFIAIDKFIEKYPDGK